jgi:hypothetical protein
MESRAWKREAFEYPPIPTMIGREERNYLHWLGRQVWSGAGCVLEIGPWLGGSTACLASGMIASGHKTSGMLRVFDNFIWREFMTHRAELPLAVGESFEAFFQKHVAPWAETIRSLRCSLPDERVQDDEFVANFRGESEPDLPTFAWDASEPVEILFLDGAKSWRGLRWLLLEVHASLLPGKSLLVCQDFKDWVSYWVPAIMVRLREHLEPVHNVLHGDTVAFRLRSPIPRAVLTALGATSPGCHRALPHADLDHAAAWLAADGVARRSAAAALHVSFLPRAREVKPSAASRTCASAGPAEGRLRLDRARATSKARQRAANPAGALGFRNAWHAALPVLAQFLDPPSPASGEAVLLLGSRRGLCPTSIGFGFG